MIPVVGGPGRLSVSNDFAGSRVDVGVQGQVDLFTAADLGAVLDAVIDRGHLRIVLDLAECDFIDSAGLQVLAEAVERLELWGGRRLTIRWPSPMVRHALERAGLAGQTDVDPPNTTTERVDHRDDGMAHRVVPTEAGRPRAAMPIGHSGDDVVDGALRSVVTLAHVVVPGSDGASVSLRRHGQLSTVAASDQTILDMDADQYAAGEGPCVDAAAQGRRFYAESLSEETRWPAFTPQAVGLGIMSILSSPLIVRNRPVGALNLYSRTSAGFADGERLASVFATEASRILGEAGAQRRITATTDSPFQTRTDEARS